MKQTVISKLIELVLKEQKLGCYQWCTHDLIAQLYIAKAMEKEQIETAFEEGMFHHTNGLCPDEYYNETYETKED
jgi:hypothetical protein